MIMAQKLMSESTGGWLDCMRDDDWIALSYEGYRFHEGGSTTL